MFNFHTTPVIAQQRRRTIEIAVATTVHGYRFRGTSTRESSGCRVPGRLLPARPPTVRATLVPLRRTVFIEFSTHSPPPTINEPRINVYCFPRYRVVSPPARFVLKTNIILIVVVRLFYLAANVNALSRVELARQRPVRDLGELGPRASRKIDRSNKNERNKIRTLLLF